ncbi:hypothetical protein LTR85_000790 [Meristemomyces frigidus]|nr:hypothetical protein LTR85_000790 [Meristemomyces frigidus]
MELMPQSLIPPGLCIPLDTRTGLQFLVEPIDWPTDFISALIDVWEAARFDEVKAWDAMKRAIRIRVLRAGGQVQLNVQDLEEAVEISEERLHIWISR